MSIFKSQEKQEKNAESVYETAKKYLKPKDGKIHITMFDSSGKTFSQPFECESKYTTEIDTILFAMQEDGYEIVDIKISTDYIQGTIPTTNFHTLIMYK
ncbi:MAG: hypothetical protein ACLSU9_10815 [Anaerovoracaceae bacterium]